MSLRRIVLRDFVIVAELDLELQAGFTVLTGETGAGKSSLLDALQLVTGGRADVGLIREGASRTEVSAEFDTDPGLLAWLDQTGFSPDASLLLRRTLDTQGKSRAWINGSPATATQLRALGEQLLDIHGQHAWQSLTRADSIRNLLDAYAGIDARAVADAWHRWRTAQDQLSQARASQDTLLRERERLAWQIGELDKLAPAADEWPDLNTEHTRLSHAQALLDAAQSALLALDEDDGNACSLVGSVRDTLQKQASIEPTFQGLCEVLNSSLAQLEDATHTLRSYLRKTELDPDRLSVLDERISLWLSLARRYKRQPEELRPCWPAGARSCRHWTPRLICRPWNRRWRPPGKAIGSKRTPSARPADEPRRNWPGPSPPPCRVWACRVVGSRSSWSRQHSRCKAGWKRSAFWWQATPAARHARSTRWPRAASCRASRWPSPSPPASSARPRP